MRQPFPLRPADQSRRIPQFYGIVRTTGPKGNEPDFTNNEYWVEMAGVISQLPLVLDPWGIILHTTNLRENITERHMLRPGQYVTLSFIPGGFLGRNWYIDSLDHDIRFFVSGEMSAVHTDTCYGIAELDCGKFWQRYQFHPSRPPTLLLAQKTIWFNGELYLIGHIRRQDPINPFADEDSAVMKFDPDAEGGAGDWVQVVPTADLEYGWDCIIYKGQLYVVGNPNSALGSVLRTSDGTTWTAADASGGPEGTCYCCTIYNDELIVGGEINSGTAKSRGVMKYNGSAWSNMGDGISVTNSSTSGTVFGMCVHTNPDEFEGVRLVCVGIFNYIEGALMSRLDGGTAYWDGSNFSEIGAGFDVNAGINQGGCLCCVSWDDGDTITLIVGTRSTSTGNPLMSWDGTSWTQPGNSLTKELASGGASCTALAVVNKELIVVGDFTDEIVFEGLGNLIRVGTWPGTGKFAGLGAGFDDSVFALVEHNGIKCAAGLFMQSGEIPAVRFARFINNLWHWEETAEFGAPVRGLISIFGKLIAVGEFLTVGGIEALRAVWSSDGGVTWDDFTTFNDTVYGVIDVAGEAWFFGEYTHGGGLVGPGLTSWTGSGAFHPRLQYLERGEEEAGIIYDAAWDGADTIILVGDFHTIQGEFGAQISANNICAYSISTGEVSAMGSGLSGAGRSVAVFGGYVWVGYDGTQAGGSNRPYFARWNISGAAWATSGITTSSPCYAVRVIDFGAGDVLAVGHHGRITGSTDEYEIVYTADGSSWTKAAGADGDLDAPVRCIIGTGTSMDFGGDFIKAGESAGTSLRSLMLVAKMDKQRRWQRIAGGLGAQVDLIILGGHSGVFGMNVFTRGHCTHIILSGDFGRMSQLYAEGLAMTTPRGMVPLQGGLTAGSSTFARHLKGAFQRARGDWIFYGNFGGAINDNILPQDHATVEREVVSFGVIRWDGRYFYPLATGLPVIPGFVCEFDGKLHAFADHAPYIYDEDNDVWDHELDLIGTDFEIFEHWSETNGGAVFDNKIFLSGIGFPPGGERYVISWAGTGGTLYDITDAILGRDLVVTTIDEVPRMFISIQASAGGAVREWNGSGFAELPASGDILTEQSLTTAIGQIDGKWGLVSVGFGIIGGDNAPVSYYDFEDQTWTIVGHLDVIGGPLWCYFSPRDKHWLIGLDQGLTETEGTTFHRIGLITYTPNKGLGVLWERGVNSWPLYIGIRREGMVGESSP